MTEPIEDRALEYAREFLYGVAAFDVISNYNPDGCLNYPLEKYRELWARTLTFPSSRKRHKKGIVVIMTSSRLFGLFIMVWSNFFPSNREFQFYRSDLEHDFAEFLKEHVLETIEFDNRTWRLIEIDDLIEFSANQIVYHSKRFDKMMEGG